MNILGLNTFSDSSAALIQDGRVIFALEEERLKRIKHYDGMPWLAIQETLQQTKLSLQDLDIIAVGWNPRKGWITRTTESLKSAYRMPTAFRQKVRRGQGYLHACLDLFRLKELLASQLRQRAKAIRVVFVDHHMAHAASAFLASPYDAADIIVADGVGENATISFFTGLGQEIRPVKQINFPHSLGHLYASVTGFLGFKMTHDEGKVMALAGFGQDAYRDLFLRLVRYDEASGTIRVDTRLLDYHASRAGYFSPDWIKLTHLHPRKADEPITSEHQNLACSLQRRVEEICMYLLQRHFAFPPGKPLCAAGGLFLNSLLNGQITRSYNRDFFIQPASGDNGVSVGAALWAAAQWDAQSKRHPLANIFWGDSFDSCDIRKSLARYVQKVVPCPDLFITAARLISDGKIVGWFRGRMEFGPRALGNRSIFASPLDPSIKDTLNQKVKHRESFRPFAGSILLDDVQHYFKDAQESPFMLKVFYFKEEYKSRFSAICHVDGSCRLQTVSAQQNPDLYRLLQEIKKRIGVGMVLNTSLNIARQAIVRRPEEAIQMLMDTDLDALVLGDFLVQKQDLDWQQELYDDKTDPKPTRHA